MKHRACLIQISLFWLWVSSSTFAAETSASWEAEWERTVKAAEEEGQVVVYKIAHDAEWHAFQKRYPKIKVVLISASAAQIQQRLLAERRAGKFLADVVRLGGGT